MSHNCTVFNATAFASLPAVIMFLNDKSSAFKFKIAIFKNPESFSLSFYKKHINVLLQRIERKTRGNT